MVLHDLFDHELGLLEIIIESLETSELSNLLATKRWPPEQKNIITTKIIERTLDYFIENRLNIIIPWDSNKSSTVTDIFEFIKGYRKEIIIRRTKGISLCKFNNNEEYGCINHISARTFVSENEPYNSQVLVNILVDKPNRKKVNVECPVGITVYHRTCPVSWWDSKKFMMVPEYIHKKICERLTWEPMRTI